MGWVKGAGLAAFLVAAGAIVADGKGAISLRDLGAGILSTGDYTAITRQLGPRLITESDRASVVTPYCKRAFGQASQDTMNKCLYAYGQTINGLHARENDRAVIYMTCEPLADAGDANAHKAAVDCYGSSAWGYLDAGTSRGVREMVALHKQLQDIGKQLDGVKKTANEVEHRIDENRRAQTGNRKDKRAVDLKNRLP